MSEVYLHGSSAQEQERLALMNRILNARCLDVVAPAAGERVLELGAGTGIFAADLAAAVAPGEVVAVERDEAQWRAARERAASVPGLDVRRGDAYDPPLAEGEWGTFDLAHARFLLEHLTRPERAVEVMLRAVRPGGRIVLVDDDHSLMRFHPDPGGMAGLWDDYALQYAALGQDAFVGRRLVALATAAGARVRATTQVNYGGAASEPGFAGLAENLAGVVATAREAMVASTPWTPEAFDGAMEAFLEWSRRPDAVIWYALPAVVAVRPAEE